VNQTELTVVVPSVNGWQDLEGCLATLEAERGSASLEVIVPERCGPEVREKVQKRFPWVVVLPVGREVTIPDMRALAFDRATAPFVAVIEDHVIVPRGWARRMLDAASSAQAVGGGVENLATDRLVDWAAYLCEYSHMLPPLPNGESTWITGNNTVYSREALERHRDVTHAGRWEGHLHEALRREGVPLIFRPEIMVGHKKHYTIGEYFSQRYLYARSYAGARALEGGTLRRLAYGLASLALPPVLLWRTVSRPLKKQVDRRLVWKSLPLTLLFVCAWSAGDIAGAWLGPGDSLSRVC
jgi:hypothetical protein